MMGKKMKYAVYAKDHTLINRSKTLRAANRSFGMKKAGMMARIEPSSKTISGYAIKRVIKRK